MGILGAVIRIIRRCDCVAGQGRRGGHRFQSCDCHSDNCDFDIHVGSRAGAGETPWAVGDRPAELGISGVVRCVHWAFLALLLPRVTNRSGIECCTSRQIECGSSDCRSVALSRRTLDTGQGAWRIAGNFGGDDSCICVRTAEARDGYVNVASRVIIEAVL